MYYESLWWREPPAYIAKERCDFFLGFSNQKVLTIRWVDFQNTYIKLWTKNEVDEYFAKHLPEGNKRHEFEDGHYYEMWRDTVTKNGCGLDIIGATIEGVYLADNESYPNTWTELFFDLGDAGWLNVHCSMDVNGYEFYNEPSNAKPQEELIQCL